MTSDCPEILCGLLIPSQLPPYKISLKTKEPISFFPREVPSDNAKCPRNVHDTPMMPPRFWSIFKTARANCTKFGGRTSHKKFARANCTQIAIQNFAKNAQANLPVSHRGPLRQCQMPTKGSRRAHDAPCGSEASSKLHVQIARNFEGRFL